MAWYVSYAGFSVGLLSIYFCFRVFLGPSTTDKWHAVPRFRFLFSRFGGTESLSDIMKFAVIAAGEGSRLLQEGVECCKPLVQIQGEPMIDRLLRIFVDNGATEIVVIVNERSTSVKEHLEQLSLPVPLRLVVRDTPSSMHSLHAIAPYLREGPFCLTTVDTIFKEDDFEEYIRTFATADADGCMAVTPFVDDEKPLYVATDGGCRIKGFHDTQEPEDKYVSGGIYCLKPNALDVLEKCIRGGMSRMRNFQRALIAEGIRLKACPFAKIVDVDHKDDIRKAEIFLKGEPVRRPVKIVGISRGNAYSPNLVDNDAAILREVAERLRSKGAIVVIYTEADFVEQCVEADYFYSMARGEAAISQLQQLEKDGRLVVNSGFGVANCVRVPMTEILTGNGIPHPESRIIRPDDTLPDDLTYPCWVKRGDACAMIKDDVCYVENRREAEQAMARFRQRGIGVMVVNEHLRGDLVKFYGVRGTDFFHWFYPSMVSHTKFGLEAVNGEARGLPLKQYADKAAWVMDVPVYGGDCVVMENGEMKIFDFNDWPSFSPCRVEAAEKIAGYIMERIANHIKK